MYPAHPFNQNTLSHSYDESFDFHCFNDQSYNNSKRIMLYGDDIHDKGVSLLIKYIFFTKQYSEYHQKIIELLKNDPTLINKKTKAGLTPLMCAVRFYREYSTKKVIKILLDHGADAMLCTNCSWNVFQIVNSFDKFGKDFCVLKLLKGRNNGYYKLQLGDILHPFPKIHTLKSFLSNAIDLNAGEKKWFEYIFVNTYHKCDYDQKLVKTIDILIGYNVDRDLKNSEGLNALEYYIDKNERYHIDVFNKLILNGFCYKNFTKAMTAALFYSKNIKEQFDTNEFINFLESHCMDEDFNFVDSEGNNILHILMLMRVSYSIIRDKELLNFLLPKVNLETKNKKGFNVVHTLLSCNWYNKYFMDTKKKYLPDMDTKLFTIQTEYNETPLFLAIKQGKSFIREIYDNYDKNVNHQDLSGKTAIMYERKFWIFEHIMDRLPNIDLTIKDNNGQTMMNIIMMTPENELPDKFLFIHHFIKNKLIELNDEVVKYCHKFIKIKISGKFNDVVEICSIGISLPKIIEYNDKGLHILEYVLFNNWNHKEVNTDMIKYITNKGCLIDNNEINNFLHKYVNEYIVNYKNIKNKNSKKKLHEYLEILSLLISSHIHYIDANHVDDNNVTILMKLIFWSDKNWQDYSENPSLKKCINIFLDLNPNINLENAEKETILTLLLKNMHITSLIEILKKIIKNGANVNHVTNSKMTPLLIAVEYGKKNCVEIIKLLIDNKVDISFQNNDGYTALMLAYKYNLDNVIDYLESINAPVNLDCSIKIIRKSMFRNRFIKKYLFKDIHDLSLAIKYNPNNENNVGSKIAKLNYEINRGDDINNLYDNLSAKIKDYLGITSPKNMVIKVKEYVNQ